MSDTVSISQVVSEHADEAGFLWLQRALACHAPNYDRQQFADLDERLDAHLDGLRVAGPEGWTLAEAALDEEEPEAYFVAGVLALDGGDDRFDQLLERAAETPQVVRGLISALGWVEPKALGGRVKALLEHKAPLRQLCGLAACAVHRKDPGPILDGMLTATNAGVRGRALRTAGEVGRRDLLPAVQAALTDDKQEVRFWARRSAVLLGDRGRALEELAARVPKADTFQPQILRLALLALDGDRAHEVLAQLSDVPDAERLRIIGAGLIGQPRYCPWLLEQMSTPVLARVAAEAFVNITGADFNTEQLEALPPDDFEDGPTEDPADESVEVPEDAALVWPSPDKVRAWWGKHQSRFASGRRVFLGAPVSPAHCVAVLKNGYQRQRELAALHLCLLQPGTVLFNTSAPARRQERLLASMA